MVPLTGQPCPTIRVELRNEVLELHGELEGTYQLSDMVNGKPSWTSEKFAIWYLPNPKKWCIGDLGEIGTDYGLRIVGRMNDAPEMPYDTKSWLYWLYSVNEFVSVFTDHPTLFTFD